MTRFALALWLLASLHPAAAQPAGTEESIPAPPAATEPSPADLSRPAAPAPPRPGPALHGLPALLEALPDGGARLRFAPGAEGLPQGAEASLAEFGRRIGAGPPGRVTVTTQASAPVADISIARRLSLARALAVKQALAAAGVAPTRIDLRPMGHTAEALDAADIQPPAPPPAR
ncbi:OmpA family protein [Belnapia sp. F-4-1]|uniref:OmpA family protein n=1 Tax=Belnapia sp. F-4-1 TaxID=1545443 RepID=UPI00068BE1D4|nr:OmpA family protein [Belnapia sp. F-4-1]